MSDRLERLVDAASSRAAWAATALADLAVRFGDEVLGLGALAVRRALPTVTDFVGPYADEVLALTSLGAGRVLPGVTAWAVFVVGYLRFSPLLYPTLGEPSEDHEFRAVVAAVTLAFALLFARTTRLGANLAVGVAVLVAGSLAFVAYFQWVVGWDLLDPDDEVFEPLARFFGGEALRADVEADLRRSGWRGVVGAGVWVLAFGTFFAIPTLVVGVLTAVLRLLFPLPDLLVLSYVLAGPLWSRLPDPARQVVAAAREGEHRLYRPATHAALIEGAALGLLVAVGAFGAAAVVWVAVGATAGAASLVALAVPASPLVAWNWLGRLAVLYAAGAYGLWFWLRVARRLPAHLDRLRGGDTVPPVARPRWLTVPPTAVVLVVFGSLVASPPASAAFAAWPLLVAGLGWFFVDTRRRDAYVANPDDYSGSEGPTDRLGGLVNESDAAALGVAVELTGLWIASTARSGGVGLAGLTAMLVLVALLWGLSRTGRGGATGTGGVAGYAFPALLVVVGAVLAALAPSVRPTPAIAAVGVVLVVAGTVLAAVRYVEG